MIKLTDLAARLAEKYSLRQEEAERFLNVMIGVMNDSLRDEKQLKIKGLGTFKVVSVLARESVDVNTGERIKIEGREKVSFVPEATMRDLVNRPFAQFETVVLRDGVDFDEIDSKFAEIEASKEEIDTPAEEIEVPKEEIEVSVEEIEVPKEEIEAPAEENEVPKEEIEAQVEEIETSTEEIENPTNEIENPMDENEKKEVTNEVQEAVSEPQETAEETPSLSSKMMEKIRKNRRKKGEEYDDDDLFDEYGYYIGPEDDDRSRIVSFFKNQKTLKWIMAIVIAMFCCLLFGITLLYLEIRKRDARIEEFASEMERVRSGNQNIDQRLAEVREAGAERFYEHERKVDSIKQIMMRDTVDYSEAVRVARVFQDAEIKRKEERLEREQKERKEAEERRQEKERREDAQRKVTISNKASLGRELEAFNSDPRVRTGAYVITGIARTVKVQKGQTLASISKAWLGPGMECYVEAVNGGIKTVEAGQELKIPSLKEKKYSTKQIWE